MAGFEARSVTPLKCDIANTRLTRALCVPEDKGPSIFGTRSPLDVGGSRGRFRHDHNRTT